MKYVVKYWALIVLALAVIVGQFYTSNTSNIKIIDGQAMTSSECYQYIKNSPQVLIHTNKHNVTAEQIAAATCDK